MAACRPVLMPRRRLLKHAETIVVETPYVLASGAFSGRDHPNLVRRPAGTVTARFCLIARCLAGKALEVVEGCGELVLGLAPVAYGQPFGGELGEVAGVLAALAGAGVVVGALASRV